MDPEQLIIEAGQQLKLIDITYQKKNGDVKTYTLEPYSFRGNKFFGWDIFEDTIKAFLVEGLISAAITEVDFTPRYIVEF